MSAKIPHIEQLSKRFFQVFSSEGLISPYIVCAIGSKHAQHLGVFESRCLMLDIALHNSTVARTQFDRLAGAVELDATGHNIDKLFMRMTMTCAFLSLRKMMTN